MSCGPFFGPLRPELHARDRAVAPRVPHHVLEICPDLALGRTASGGEDPDNRVFFLWSEIQGAADLRTLEPRRHLLADDTLFLASVEIAAGDDLEMGTKQPRRRLHPAHDDVRGRPVLRWAIGMFSSSSAAIGLPSLSFSIPGKTSRSSAFEVSKPPVVSVTEPLRITIKSSGSPETFRLCSSPSTRPNRMHDDQTTSPVPSVVITVVFQRTCRLRTLYLSGIMAVQITLRRPSITERFAARTAG